MAQHTHPIIHHSWPHPQVSRRTLLRIPTVILVMQHKSLELLEDMDGERGALSL